MILRAEALRVGDLVAGYGTVTAVREHHHPACPGACFRACTTVPRVVVEFEQQAGVYVLFAHDDLAVLRPDLSVKLAVAIEAPKPAAEPDFRPDLLDDGEGRL